MKNMIFAFAALAVFAGGFSGCAGMTGRDEVSADFDKETSADDARVREAKTRTNLGQIETAVADYVKSERKVPAKLDDLVPKYLPDIPSVEIPACGADSNDVRYYPPDVLHGGQVDASRIRGEGKWGYVHDESRVVIFVDCLKPSITGAPWYRVRGIY